MRAAWCVVIGLCAACSSESGDLYLGFPPFEVDDTLVFSFPNASGRRIVAVDAAQMEDFSANLDEATVRDGDAEVLVYPRGTVPLGVLAPAPEGEIGLPLPDPDQIYRLRFDETPNLASWEATSAPLPVTSAFRRKFCEPVNITSETWDVTGFVRFAVGIDEQYALFATSDATSADLYVSDGNAPTKVRTFIPPNDAPRTAWRGPGDEIWFGDFRGRISRGRVEVGGIVDARIIYEFPTTFFRVESIDGHINDDGTVEVFAVSSRGEIVRWDGTSFVMVDGMLDGEGEYIVMWRAPGQAMVVARETTSVGRVVGDRLMRDETPGKVFAIRFIPGLGEILGVSTGEFYLRENDGQWRQLGRTFSTFPLAFEPTADGFKYLVASGRVGRYHHPLGFCPDGNVVPVLGFVGSIAPVGDDLFVAGELNSAVGVSQGARVVFGP